MITLEAAMLYVKLQCMSTAVNGLRETTVAMCPAREMQGPTLPTGWKAAEVTKPVVKKKATKKKKKRKHRRRK